MAKYKKCPRCELNYILEEEDYCQICKEELRGISHNEELLDDEEDADVVAEMGLCPKCKQHYLNDGEKICEACAALERDGQGGDDFEPEAWDIEEENPDADTELVEEEDDNLDLGLEDLGDEEGEFDEEEEEEYSDEIADDFEDIDLEGLDALDDEEEDVDKKSDEDDE